MIRYEKRPSPSPKITKTGIVLNIIIAIIPIIIMILIWEGMNNSVGKELFKCFLAILNAIGILYLVHRLMLNKVWFDHNDGEYKTEYIELYDDHIKIYDRCQTYSGHYYNYAKIYYDDISHTFISGVPGKVVYYIEIYIKRKNSEKSFVEYDGEKLTKRYILVHMIGYPDELSLLLEKNYKRELKIV